MSTYVDHLTRALRNPHVRNFLRHHAACDAQLAELLAAILH